MKSSLIGETKAQILLTRSDFTREPLLGREDWSRREPISETICVGVFSMLRNNDGLKSKIRTETKRMKPKNVESGVGIKR